MNMIGVVGTIPLYCGSCSCLSCGFKIRRRWRTERNPAKLRQSDLLSALDMSRITRYISNVIWNGASVAVLILAGFVMAPIIIQHIGDKNYGEWTLVLALVEYYWL